jgi:hypothetical protein
MLAAMPRLLDWSFKQYLHRLIDDFEKTLTDRWAYYDASKADFPAAIKAIRTKIDTELPAKLATTPLAKLREAGLSADAAAFTQDITIAMRKVVAMGIDGHATTRVRLPEGYLPFRIDMTGDRVVAFRPDRSGFVVPGHPFLESIDGRAMTDWIQAARPLATHGSPAIVRSQLTDDYLLCIRYLREQMGLPQKDTLDAVFVSEDGRREARTFEISKDRPTPMYERWPSSIHNHQGEPYALCGERDQFGYLRLDAMWGEPRASTLINEAMSRFRDTKGLIVDVRGNSGGGTQALHALMPYLMSPDEAPQVVSAARFRLGADYDAGHVEFWRKATADAAVWDAGQRAAIDRFKAAFRPEWTPPADKFSPWYYEVVSRSDNPVAYHYRQPVIVLQDNRCFSATDVFLSALKGRPRTTLMGVPSAGGSGSPAKYTLLVDFYCVLGRYMDFRPNGLLIDGRGIEPDVIVRPSPAYFIGKEDNVMDEAIAVLRQKADKH